MVTSNGIRLYCMAKTYIDANKVIEYLCNNAKNFSISVNKTFECLIRDENDFLFDIYAGNEEQNIEVECVNDSVLIDGLLAIPSVEWVESQVI